jgi:hypothetical protein
MDEPRQQTLFHETGHRWKLRASYPDTNEDFMELLLPEDVTHEEARAHMRRFADFLVQARAEFDGHITPEGRMYGLQGQRQVVIEMISLPTYSYTQEPK